MKILIKWWTGRRERADFRMLFEPGTVEKKSTSMLGEEHWAPCNPGQTIIDKVRKLAVDALSIELVKLARPEWAMMKIDATIDITKIGPVAEKGIVIDLGEVCL